MNIVELDENLIENNAAILAGEKEATRLELAAAPLNGIIYDGYNKVYAKSVPGLEYVKVTFEINVPSITARTFDEFRSQVADVLGNSKETQIANAAGIKKPLPVPANRMAWYTVHLFSKLFQVNPGHYLDQNRAFSENNCKMTGCARLLRAIRDLEVSRLNFHGTIVVKSTPTIKSDLVEAYVRVASIVYEDNVTIPFSGYSTNVKLTRDDCDPGIDVHESFWTD